LLYHHPTVVILSSYGRSPHIIVLLVSSFLYHRIVIVIWLLSYGCRRRILVSYPDFENPATIMACGTLTPVVVWRNRTAVLTFFSCAALFFGMLATALYSVVTNLSSKIWWQCDPSRVPSWNLNLLDES
jgi:hypothetical protein